MKSLFVLLMEGKKPLEETEIKYSDGWVEKYLEACRKYAQETKLNNKLRLRVGANYH